MKSLLALVCLFAFQTARAEAGFTAKIYEPDSKKQKLLFTQKQENEKTADGRMATNTFTDPSGTVVVVEKVEFVKDGEHEKVRSYTQQQKQINTEGSVKVKDGKATFTFTKEGKTQTKEESVGDDFVAGPGIPAYIKRHWGKIQGGEKVAFRLALPDRLETIGFELKKVNEEDIGGQKAVVIRMRPSSFFIAALVNPLQFYMSPDGQKLLELHGRTAAKRKDGDKYKDLDAVVVYEYPSAGNSK